MADRLPRERLRLALWMTAAAEVLMVGGVVLRGGGVWWWMTLGPVLAALSIVALGKVGRP